MGVNALSRDLSNALLAELYGQESGDPFLALFTFSHPSFDTIRLVNNTVDIVSNGETFMAFPVNITMSPDNGETLREVQLELDNVSLELIEELRTVTDYIDVKVEMVLASNPDFVEIELGELKIKNVQYNASRITARLFMDDFLNTELSGEKYAPTNFPGLFS